MHFSWWLWVLFSLQLQSCEHHFSHDHTTPICANNPPFPIRVVLLPSIERTALITLCSVKCSKTISASQDHTDRFTLKSLVSGMKIYLPQTGNNTIKRKNKTSLLSSQSVMHRIEAIIAKVEIKKLNYIVAKCFYYTLHYVILKLNEKKCFKERL